MKSPQKVVAAPASFVTARYNLELDLKFGGKFVHSPIAKYVNGGSFLVQGLNGSHASLVSLENMCVGPLIGVDGCHLNGEYGGVLLTVVGIDPNNNTYPIAWAVVKVENHDNWDWFLSLLETDLEMHNHKEWTWVSDKQKGLCKAFDEQWADSENRFCVKHLHGNMKTTGFTGSAVKDLLWELATATTPAQFQRRWERLEKLNDKAAAWLKDRPAKNWSRVFFSPYPKCEMLLNNGCETFNSVLLDARELGIISMLEWISHYVMTRFRKNRNLCADKWKSKKICPSVREILNQTMELKPGCYVEESTQLIFSVDMMNGEVWSVNLGTRSCGCRKWELSGIPCVHAIACIEENGWEVEDFVHSAYHVDTYRKCYESHAIPINGRQEWRRTGYTQPKPPNEGRSVGRPEKTRRRAADEPGNKKRKCRGGKPPAISKTDRNKLKRNQTTCKCGYCGEIGHNSLGCLKKKEDQAQKQLEDIANGVDVETEIVGPSKKRKITQPKKGPNVVKARVKETQISKKSVPTEVIEADDPLTVALKSKLQSTTSTPSTVQTSTPHQSWEEFRTTPTEILISSVVEQMVSCGIGPNTRSRNIKVVGTTVHMRQTPPNVISSSQVARVIAEQKKKVVAKRNQKNAKN